MSEPPMSETSAPAAVWSRQNVAEAVTVDTATTVVTVVSSVGTIAVTPEHAQDPGATISSHVLMEDPLMGAPVEPSPRWKRWKGSVYRHAENGDWRPPFGYNELLSRGKRYRDAIKKADVQEQSHTDLFLDLEPREASSKGLLVPVVKSLGIANIEHDLRRTRLPQDQHGCLENVLLAYVGHNREVGYFQPMSHVASLLIAVAGTREEEEVFITFACLMDHYGLKEFCRSDLQELPMAHSYSRALARMVRRGLPDLHQKLTTTDSNFFSPGMAPWFVTLLCNRLPRVVVENVFDAIFETGPRGHGGFQHVLAVAYLVFQTQESALSDMDNDQLMHFQTEGLLDADPHSFSMENVASVQVEADLFWEMEEHQKPDAIPVQLSSSSMFFFAGAASACSLIACCSAGLSVLGPGAVASTPAALTHAAPVAALTHAAVPVWVLTPAILDFSRDVLSRRTRFLVELVQDLMDTGHDAGVWLSHAVKHTTSKNAIEDRTQCLPAWSPREFLERSSCPRTAFDG